MPPTKSESLLGEIGKNTKKIADELSIIANTRTGKKKNVAGLERASDLLAGATAGAFASPAPGGRPAAAILGAGAVGSHVLANYLRQQDERFSRVFTISEALDAYEKNLRIKESKAKEADKSAVDENRNIRDRRPLIDAQKAATFENQAIIAGLADAWERLATIWNLIKDFTGISVDPARAQEVLDGLQAIRDALAEISNMTNDSEATKQLSRIREFLARSAPTAPSAPTIDGLGRPLTDDNISPRFLGSTSRLGGNAGDATRRFIELNAEVERLEALTGPLATGLAETNTQLGSQAERLRGLGVLLPDIARQLVDVFDSGTLGAERLDSAVRAVGDRFLDAFEGAIRRGESLGDVLKSLARDLANLALNQVKTGGISGLFDILGGLFTSTVLPAAGSQSGPRKGAKGLVFTNGRLDRFARGGAFDMGARLDRFAKGNAFTNSIVNRPTLFPMASGAGLMGEAGPEAVLPLTRLANGELGVQTPAPAAAAGPVITYNIDARGADREGLSRLAAVVREQGATINYINRTLERRAVEAVVYTRGRGGNIARAFGGW